MVICNFEAFPFFIDEVRPEDLPSVIELTELRLILKALFTSTFCSFFCDFLLSYFFISSDWSLSMILTFFFGGSFDRILLSRGIEAFFYRGGSVDSTCSDFIDFSFSASLACSYLLASMNWALIISMRSFSTSASIFWLIDRVLSLH